MENHGGHRHAVTQVSMDMSPSYQKGVKETCRNAQVVFDKFHVAMRATKPEARGYRSTTHLITMLYFTAGNLHLPQF